MAMPPLSKRIFNKFDTDNSGSISKSEFKALCYNMGASLDADEIELAVKVLDSDGSGSIDYNEFKKWWSTENRFAKLQLTEEELSVMTKAVEYFSFFDKDLSGTICKEEAKALHSDLVKNGLTKKTLDVFIQDLDSSGDQVISYNEYIDWLIREGSLKVKVLP